MVAHRDKTHPEITKHLQKTQNTARNHKILVEIETSH